MAISEETFAAAGRRMRETRSAASAVAARYDRGKRQIVVDLSGGVELRFSPEKAEGLAGVSAADLSEIEISPSGLGLRWPRLDADLYLPALLSGVLGSRKWIAAQMGAAGGRARTTAKSIAARENGRRGGRPRKRA